MNLRNLAKIQNHIGDSRTALATNIEAIRQERVNHSGFINTNVYRKAAVQSVTKGEQEQALQLVREVRSLEGKLFQSPTTERTTEILAKLLQRKGDVLDRIKKENSDAQERDAILAYRKRVGAK
jgi:hypothetical protein